MQMQFISMVQTIFTPHKFYFKCSTASTRSLHLNPLRNDSTAKVPEEGRSGNTCTADISEKSCRCSGRSEERRVGKECRSRCDWSSDVCSSDLLNPLRNDSTAKVPEEGRSGNTCTADISEKSCRCSG